MLIELVAAVATALAPTAHPAWKSYGEDVVKGPLSASLRYEKKTDSSGFTQYRHASLTVRRDGQTLYAGRACVSASGICEPYYGSGGLSLRNVWGSSEPEVVLDLYTGGNKCCTITDFVLYRRGRGQFVEHNFGNGNGYRGDKRDGIYYFVSHDNRFGYVFASGAGSAYPVQVWTFNRAGAVVDVTRKRLDLVRADARDLWDAYLRSRRSGAEVGGLLAAWCADQHILGNRAACESELQRAEQTGILRRFGGAPRRYVALLRRDLVRWGYARR